MKIDDVSLNNTWGEVKGIKKLASDAVYSTIKAFGSQDQGSQDVESLITT